jgi:urease subunit gamma/beta
MRLACCYADETEPTSGVNSVVGMHLAPSDTEKLLLSVAGMVARDRLARGVLLNHPEAVALLSTWVIERAREGMGVSELMEAGRGVLTASEVLPDVPPLLHDVQVEATFPDGRKLVTIHDPIRREPDEGQSEGHGDGYSDGPGAVRLAKGDLEINADRTAEERGTLVIVNTGDRPVQIGSHLHLPDANAALDFDREAAQGFRLDIPSGTSRRFEPGASRVVPIVSLRGRRVVPGLQVRADG